MKDALSCLGEAVRHTPARKQFFFEKKNQKTFDYNRFALPQRAYQGVKVFCFFSSEKKVLSCCRSVNLIAGWYGPSTRKLKHAISNSERKGRNTDPGKECLFLLEYRGAARARKKAVLFMKKRTKKLLIPIGSRCGFHAERRMKAHILSDPADDK